MTTMKLQVAIIVARAINGVIGRDNGIPWRLPSDYTYFQNVTMGNAVIMGRKTYESLPPKFAPLKGRINIIISRNADYDPQVHSGREDYNPSEVFVVTSLEAAYELCLEKGWLTPFIMGGGEIYAMALQNPNLTKVYITEVGCETEGNVSFPDLDPDVWILTKSWQHTDYDNNQYSFRWDVYERAA